MAKQGSISGFTLKFLLRLFLGVSFLLLLCFIWPIFIYRKLVSILASICRSDLGLILSPQNTLLNPASNPTLNVCIQLRLSGKLDLSRLKSRFTQECIFRKYPSTGRFLFPEFQQYYTTWLGFSFWKNEANFQIDQHIHHLVLNKTEDLEPELRKVLETEFSDSQNPWEIHFVETIANPSLRLVQVSSCPCGWLLHLKCSRRSSRFTSSTTPVQKRGTRMFEKSVIMSFNYPIEIANERERLKAIENQLQWESKMKSCFVGYLLPQRMGSLPPCWVKSADPNCIFPGPTTAFSVCGNPVDDMSFAVNGAGNNICGKKI